MIVDTSRARLLAPSSYIDLLCFDIGDERYATLLDSVDEVIDGVDLSFTATGGSVAGVLKLRGKLIPAYAPDRTFGSSPTVNEPLAIVFPFRDHQIALLVDHAEAAVGVHSSQFREVPSLVGGDRVLIGALRVNDRWTGLVDPDAMVESLTATGATEDE